MIAAAVRAVQARTALVPDVAVILGTGLGALADEIQGATRISYRDIPGFPLATVESHAGQLLLGTLAGRRVAAMQGRFHRYEGYTLQQIAFPVRVLHALGQVMVFIDEADQALGKRDSAPAVLRGTRAGSFSIFARHSPGRVSATPLDDAPIRGVRNCGGIQRSLPIPAGTRHDRPFRRL